MNNRSSPENFLGADLQDDVEIRADKDLGTTKARGVIPGKNMRAVRTK
jgi:hypothetical protein